MCIILEVSVAFEEARKLFRSDPDVRNAEGSRGRTMEKTSSAFEYMSIVDLDSSQLPIQKITIRAPEGSFFGLPPCIRSGKEKSPGKKK